MLIECIKGYSKNDLPGRTYNFDRDKQGRFVATVNDIKHRELFLSQPSVFREVSEDPADDADEAIDTADDGVGLEDIKEPGDGGTAPGAADGGSVTEPGEPVKPATEPAESAEDGKDASEATTTEADAGDAPKDIDAMSRDELKAHATSLGIEFNARIRTDKLIDLILEAEDDEDGA